MESIIISIDKIIKKDLNRFRFMDQVLIEIKNRYHISHLMCIYNSRYTSRKKDPQIANFEQIKYFYIRRRALKIQIAKLNLDIDTESIPDKMLLMILGIEDTISINYPALHTFGTMVNNNIEIEVKVL